jgi:acyl-CoA thioesterase
VSGCQDFLHATDLEALEPGRYRTRPDAAAGVIFGGELMAQMIRAAGLFVPEKAVKTLHAIFARAGRASDPVEIQVEPLHLGRQVGSLTVTMQQGERLCSRGLLLLTVPEPDLIRHQLPMPPVGEPAAAAAREMPFLPGELRVVGDIDLNEPDQSLAPRVSLWTRCPELPDELSLQQGLLANDTEGFLIAAAMLPHAGVGQAQAHMTLSTGVLSHTVMFHEPIDLRDWVLIDQQSTHAGHGRSAGAGNVWSRDGRLLASFSQENMVRRFPEGRAPAGSL